MAFIVSPAIPPALHGKEATGLAHAVDWAPTLLRIAGVGVNSSGGVLLHGIDGLDVVRLSRPILLDVSEPLDGFADDLIWLSSKDRYLLKIDDIYLVAVALRTNNNRASCSSWLCLLSGRVL